jgi:hypothetical protein
MSAAIVDSNEARHASTNTSAPLARTDSRARHRRIIGRPVLLSAVLAVVSVLVGHDARALSSGDLGDVRIVGHHFTTRVSDGRRATRVKNPVDSRYVVVKLAIDVPADRSPIFLNDFVLQYVRSGGKEGRSACRVLCRAKTDRLGENGSCMMGESNALVFDRSQKYMTLTFFVKSDVSDVRIARTGAAPIEYSIGSDRPYSVYLTTNQGLDAIAPVEAAIRAGGYQLTNVGTALSKKTSGIVIHYSEKAETQGREISQRLMTSMSVAPTVKALKLMSDHDVVVWVGN